MKVCWGLFLPLVTLSGVKSSFTVAIVSIVVLFAAVSVLMAFSRYNSGLLYFISFHISSFIRFKVAPASKRKSISNMGFCFVKSCSSLVHRYIGSIQVGLLSNVFIIELYLQLHCKIFPRSLDLRLKILMCICIHRFPVGDCFVLVCQHCLLCLYYGYYNWVYRFSCLLSDIAYFVPNLMIFFCYPYYWNGIYYCCYLIFVQVYHIHLSQHWFDISSSSRLWSTVSKAALRSEATIIELLQGFFWLRPFCVLLVTTSRAVVVEFSSLKPCWCCLIGCSIKSLSNSFSVSPVTGRGVQLDCSF